MPSIAPRGAALMRRLRQIVRADRGNVTVTFALAIVPVVGLVGAAVDYSHANSVKAAMQAAADSTALMLSREAASINNSQLQTKANSYFKALFTRPEATGVQVTAVYTTQGGSKINVDATSQVKTDFMKLMGFSLLDVAVNSQVAWGNSRLRVALALDVTGSMASAGKMNAMKTAAKGFLKQLEGAASKNGDVYVSIIPFNKDVNVGKSNHDQNWIRWDLWEERNGTCHSSGGGGGGKGKGKGKGGGSSGGETNHSTKSSCESAGNDWTPDDTSSWNGCITDRDTDYDTQNTPPSQHIKATQFPAEQFNSCPRELMPLTYDWDALKDKIDSLQSTGNTNQTIGLQWAFQSLTSAPFAIPPKEANYEYSEVIILMTDGDNTENRFTTSKNQIDARTTKTCDNVKAANITLYTVQVNTDGTPTQKFLQACASTPDKFFLLTSANQLAGTFQQIGTSLSNLRVAK